MELMRVHPNLAIFSVNTVNYLDHDILKRNHLLQLKGPIALLTRLQLVVDQGIAVQPVDIEALFESLGVLEVEFDDFVLFQVGEICVARYFVG